MSSRLVDAIYNAEQVNAGASPTLDLNFGGMMGAMPRYGYLDPKSGKYYGEWISSTPYTRENVIPVLLAYPLFMDWLPDSKKWIGMTKAIFETEAQSITGLKATVTVETDSVPVGGAGAVFEVPTDVKLEQSSLSYTFKERKGRPFTKFHNFWIEYGIMDPHTKRAKVLKFLKNPTSNEEFTMYTPDFYSATVLFIEPAEQFTVVEKAWLGFNIWPKTSGSVEGSRDITTAKATEDVTIDYAGIFIHTDAVVNLAKAILPRLATLYEIPDQHMTLPIAGLEPSVKDNDTAHSHDLLQGNGELEWDTHPAAK